MTELPHTAKRISGRKFVPWFALILAAATVTFAWFARSTEQVRREARARFMAAESREPRGPMTSPPPSSQTRPK